MANIDTDEEILEPTPYENAYRRTLMDDDPSPETPDPDILDIPGGDTQEMEGLIRAQDGKEHEWKKRYSDLKSYHDRKNNEWLQQHELTEAKLNWLNRKFPLLEIFQSLLKNWKNLKLNILMFMTL